MPLTKFVFPIINWILMEITIPGGFLFVFSWHFFCYKFYLIRIYSRGLIADVK